MATTDELKTQISEMETAIHELATGRVAAYTVQGQTYQYINLSTMREYKAELERKLDRQTGASRKKAEFRRPT